MSNCGCTTGATSAFILPPGTIGFPMPLPAPAATEGPAAGTATVGLGPFYAVATERFTVPAVNGQVSIKAAGSEAWARAGLLLWFPGIGWLEVVSAGSGIIIAKNTGGMIGGFNLEAGTEFRPTTPYPATAVGQAFCAGGGTCACDATALAASENPMVGVCGPDGFRSSPLTLDIVARVLARALGTSTPVDAGVNGITGLALVDGALKLFTARSGMKLLKKRVPLVRQYAGSGIGSQVDGGSALGAMSGNMSVAGSVPSGTSVVWLLLQGGVALNGVASGSAAISINGELDLSVEMQNENDVDRDSLVYPVEITNGQFSYAITLSGAAAYASISLVAYQV